jgi:hypothetical protein
MIIMLGLISVVFYSPSLTKIDFLFQCELGHPWLNP